MNFYLYFSGYSFKIPFLELWSLNKTKRNWKQQKESLFNKSIYWCHKYLYLYVCTLRWGLFHNLSIWYFFEVWIFSTLLSLTNIIWESFNTQKLCIPVTWTLLAIYVSGAKNTSVLLFAIWHFYCEVWYLKLTLKNKGFP